MGRLIRRLESINYYQKNKWKCCPEGWHFFLLKDEWQNKISAKKIIAISHNAIKSGKGRPGLFFCQYNM